MTTRRVSLWWATGLLSAWCCCVYTTTAFSIAPGKVATHRDTALASAGNPELMSAILVMGTAVAAYQEYRTDKFEAVKEFTKLHRKSLSSLVEQVESAKDDLESTLEENAAIITKDEQPKDEEPEPVVVVVEEMQEEVVVAVEDPAVTMVKAQKKEEKEEEELEVVMVMPVSTKVVQEVEAPAPKTPIKPPAPTAPKPVAVTLPKKEPALARSSADPVRTASDDLTDLVKKVGKTVEQNKEMEERVKARRQQHDMQAKTQQEENGVEKEMNVKVPAVLTAEKEVKKKRSVLRKAWRVTKKVVAPWRKWENIS